MFVNNPFCTFFLLTLTSSVQKIFPFQFLALTLNSSIGDTNNVSLPPSIYGK